MSVGPSAKNDSPNNTRMVTPPPKKSITTKVIDSGKNLITARKRAAHNLAGLIPGQEERLKNYRTDYRNYLTSEGSTPAFLQDDKNLTSFETYDNLIKYEPTQKKTLNYADYLAEEKGNYNLQRAGNVGGMNETGEGKNVSSRNQKQIKPVMLDATTAPTQAEVSQSAAADAETYDSIKTKKRGRSMTRLNSSKGVTDNKLTLGKPSLLGA
tara:strand:+ start:464 stop:1096 length:633 start_codon:yes stop_codon:yes gene_type:complete